MHRKFLVLLSVLFTLYNSLQAQEIRGKIVDSITKKPLPFVNIIYGQSNFGTTTNIDGNFTIDSNTPVKELRLSYLGYKPDTILLNPESANKKLEIKLEAKAYNLEEIVILPGENPANRIINKVVENRDMNNPEKMHSFSFTSYNKMIYKLGKDTLLHIDSTYIKNKLEKKLEKHHLLIIETVNEKEFLYPDKYKEEIVASKISGFSDPIFGLIASQVQSLSFYNDFFEILDKTYLNPISKNSTKRYFFLLEDTMYNEKNDTIFVVSFRPKKGKSFTGLKGFLHINTNKYAVQSVVAEPLEEDKGMLVEIKQNCEFVENKQWFPKELITNITFKEALASSGTEDYDLIALGSSYISNINLNPEVNKKDFNRVEVKIDENATDKSDNYWIDKRIQPLSEVETETYRIIDSISKAEKLEKKLAGLEAFMNLNIPLKCFNLPIVKIIDYNNYEGYRLGLGLMTNDKISKYFSVGGYFGYGFKDKEWKYGGDLILNLHKNSESKLHFAYLNDVVETAGYKFLETMDFTSTEIYRRYMIKDMDLIEKYEVSFSFLSFQYLQTQIFYNQSHITSTNDYTYEKSPTVFINDFTFNEIGLQFRYSYNEKFLQTLKAKYSMGTDYPIFYGNIIRGTNWLDGEYEYTKIEAKITKRFKFKTLGKTSLAATGGLIEGEAPLTKLYNGHGSYISFSIESENSFGTMRLGEFYADRFLSFFFKHDFGNILIKTEKFSPKFAIVTNYGIGSISNKAKHNTGIPVKSFDKGYYESGLLINNILNQSFIGLGFGLFYRYGPYTFLKTADNFAYKMSLTIGL